MKISGFDGSIAPLRKIETSLKNGEELLHSKSLNKAITLLDFWRWSTSDLVSNSTRGVLAEFIIATALGVPVDTPREEWAAWDLTTPEGIKVEVKSAAYVQTWEQKKLSTITFNTPKTHSTSEEAKRQADVYVLALLAHQDKPTIDPLNLDQWTFFVLPTAVLDARERSQHSITLPSLLALHGPGICYSELREAVLKAASSTSALA